MHQSKPSVYQYDDHSNFLKDWFSFQKKTKGLTQHKFSERAGIKSHTLLGMVIQKKRRLTLEMTRSFTSAMGLSQREAQFFEHLVQFNQTKDANAKVRHLSVLASRSPKFQETSFAKLSQYADYLSDWLIVALRELSIRDDFKLDPYWIRAQFKNKVTIDQVEKAIVKLQSSGLLANREKFDIAPEEASFVVKNYHIKMLEKAIDAASTESFEERELSSLVLSCSDEDLVMIREKMNDFRKELSLLVSESKTKKKHIIAINAQMLKLTGEEKNETSH